MSTFKQRIGGLAGITAPLLAFICIAIAIVSYPDFSWTGNALSDLGIISGLTGLVFNFGIFTCGLLALIFAMLGLYNYFGQNLVGRIGALTFMASTIALMVIGIFNENFKPTHYLVSVAFFTLSPLALFIIALAFHIVQQRGMTVFTLIIGIISAFVWILQFMFQYLPNVAVPEVISGLAFSVWAVVMSLKMIKK